MIYKMVNEITLFYSFSLILLPGSNVGHRMRSLINAGLHLHFFNRLFYFLVSSVLYRIFISKELKNKLNIKPELNYFIIPQNM